MDREVKNTLLQVGIVYGAFVLLVKPLIPSLGATPEEEAAIKSVDTAENPNNAFNAQYAPMVNDFSKAYNSGATGGMNMCEYIRYFKNQWDEMETVPPIDPSGKNGVIDAITGAEYIYNSFSFWKSHSTGHTYDIMPVFHVVSTKSQVASIAAVLQCLYGVDLWQLLKEGTWFMLRGLSSSDLKYIIDRVNSLPN